MGHQGALHHLRAGVVGPYAAAAHEMFLRGKLEQFRDFASARYLENRSLTLDDIKQEWLDLVVKDMAKSPFTRANATALKAGIVAMTHAEALIGESKQAQQADAKAPVATPPPGK